MWLTLRILAWRSRRLALVLALAAFALATAHVAAPPAARTQAVVVAAHPLAAGATLSDEDLRLVRLPAALVPESVTADPARLRGRVVATAVPRGLPVVTESLTAGRFAVAPPAGSAVVAIEVEPGLLTPGDRVDLVAVGCPAGAADPGAASDGGLAGPWTVAQGALVVDVADRTATVALPADAGRTVAGAEAGCTVRSLLRT